MDDDLPTYLPKDKQKESNGRWAGWALGRMDDAMVVVLIFIFIFTFIVL